nr:PAS domain S-box protein [FCB group bacterium]
MDDIQKTKDMLLGEVKLLRQQAADLKQSYDSLAATEEKYRILFETMSPGVVYQDVDGRIISANPSSERILGLSIDQMQGRKSVDPRWKATKADGSDFPGEEHPAMVALKTGEPVRNVVMRVYNPKDDSHRWININATPLFKPDELKPCQVYTTFNDITHRIRAEELLRKERDYNKTLVEASPLFFIAIDADWKTSMMNQSMLDALGYSLDEVEGKDYLSNFVPEEDRELLGEVFKTLTSSREMTKNENHVLTKDNRKLLVEWHGRPVIKPDGSFDFFFCVGIDITERRIMVDALRESEEQYRLLAENTEDVIWVLNNDDQFTYVSPSVRRLRGFEPEEVMKESLRDAVTPESYEVLTESRKRFRDVEAKAKGKKDLVNRFEIEQPCKDGSTVWVEVIAKRLFDDKGEPVGVIGSARNISDRKRAEEALKESEEEFRNIVQASPMGMHLYQLDDSNRLVFIGANPPADKILGVDNQQFVGKTIEEAFPPLIETEIPARYREVASTGIRWQTEQISYQDEKIAGAFEVYAFQSSPGRMVAAFLDKTERKRTEDALRESEERYRTIFESMIDCMFIANIDGYLVEANPAASRTYGYEHNELIGQHMAELIHPDHRHTFKEFTRKLHDEGQHQAESVSIRRDGSVFNTNVHGSLVLYQGNPHIMAMVRDVTEQKIADAAMKESEEKFRILADQSPNMIFINQKGRIVYANPKCVEVMGYSSEEFYSPDFNFQSLIAPEYVEVMMGNFKKHMMGQDVKPIEYKLISRNGREINSILSTKLITYLGKPAILGTVTDITERKRSEEALQKSEERYRLVIQNQGEGIGYVDIYEVFQMCNPAAEEIFGVEPGNLVGRSIFDFLNQEMIDLVRNQSKIRSKGEKSSYEVEICHPDGETRNLLVT